MADEGMDGDGDDVQDRPPTNPQNPEQSTEHHPRDARQHANQHQAPGKNPRSALQRALECASAVATVVIAVATVVNVFVAGLQWGLTRDALEETRRSNEISVVPILAYEGIKIDPGPAAGQRSSIRASFVNRGNGQAVNVMADINVELVLKGQPINYKPWINMSGPSPAQTLDVDRGIKPLKDVTWTDDQIALWRSGAADLVIVGSLEYSSILGTRYGAGFCWRYHREGDRYDACSEQALNYVHREVSR